MGVYSIKLCPVTCQVPAAYKCLLLSFTIPYLKGIQGISWNSPTSKPIESTGCCRRRCRQRRRSGSPCDHTRPCEVILTWFRSFKPETLNCGGKHGLSRRLPSSLILILLICQRYLSPQALAWHQLWISSSCFGRLQARPSQRPKPGRTSKQRISSIGACWILSERAG